MPRMLPLPSISILPHEATHHGRVGLIVQPVVDLPGVGTVLFKVKLRVSPHPGCRTRSAMCRKWRVVRFWCGGGVAVSIGGAHQVHAEHDVFGVSLAQWAAMGNTMGGGLTVLVRWPVTAGLCSPFGTPSLLVTMLPTFVEL